MAVRRRGWVIADGTVLERYASKQTPEDIEADITPLLG